MLQEWTALQEEILLFVINVESSHWTLVVSNWLLRHAELPYFQFATLAWRTSNKSDDILRQWRRQPF